MSDSEGRFIGAGEQAMIEIVRTSELLARVGSSCVFDDELSQARFNILIILKYYGDGGVSQKEILERMVSTKGNLSMHIKKLAADGYISRRSSKVDRRHDMIRLTAKGEQALLCKEPEYMRYMEELTSGLTQSNAEIITKLLGVVQDKCRALLQAVGELKEESL